MQSPKAEKRKQENLTCDICGIEVNSQQMMDAHIRGQKHIKKMKFKNESVNQTFDNINIDQNSTVSLTTENKPNQSSTIIKPSVSSSNKSVLQIMNELAKSNKVTAKYDLIKETGPAHCKQFEVQLTVADEIYTGIGTSIKRAQQIAAEHALAVTTLKNPEQIRCDLKLPQTLPKEEIHTNSLLQEKIYPSTDQQQINSNYENTYENFLNRKFNEISEYDNVLIQLHNFVNNIERAMKIVSDKMMQQCQINNICVVPQSIDNIQFNNIEQINQDPSESYRMLKGAMKVSILAMRLFLKTDYEYSLVLICANKPTITLLNDICQELMSTLNNQLDSFEDESISNIYQVEAFVNDACLIIKSSLLPKHTIRIMLTSPVFHDENIQQNLVELNSQSNDILDRHKCLQAATEIRHSNWFTQYMLNYRSNSFVLRLLRNLQYNQTPLSNINLWCLVLLVHKCQNQSKDSMTKLFHAVFACLSSGILLPNRMSPGINDPCEKDLIDITDYLTNEQRINITTYAQHILRLISFGQFDKIFSIQ